MIEVSRYTPDLFDSLLAMHESHNSNPGFTPDTLPQIGYIASDSATHVAMGFLRLVEGGYAQIDTLVVNNHVHGDIRNKGLQMVVDELISTAKEMKLKGIVSFTSNERVLMRAVETGFKVTPHAVMYLSLGV